MIGRLRGLGGGDVFERLLGVERGEGEKEGEALDLDGARLEGVEVILKEVERAGFGGHGRLCLETKTAADTRAASGGESGATGQAIAVSVQVPSTVKVFVWVMTPATSEAMPTEAIRAVPLILRFPVVVRRG